MNLDADNGGAHFLPATLGVKRKLDDSDERTTLAMEKALPETAPSESSSDEEDDEDELEEEESEEEPVIIISYHLTLCIQSFDSLSLCPSGKPGKNRTRTMPRQPLRIRLFSKRVSAGFCMSLSSKRRSTSSRKSSLKNVMSLTIFGCACRHKLIRGSCCGRAVDHHLTSRRRLRRLKTLFFPSCILRIQRASTSSRVIPSSFEF